MLDLILCALGCHRCYSWPQTPINRQTGARTGQTTVVCASCKRHLPYDMATMRIARPAGAGGDMSDLTVGRIAKLDARIAAEKDWHLAKCKKRITELKTENTRLQQANRYAADVTAQMEERAKQAETLVAETQAALDQALSMANDHARDLLAAKAENARLKAELHNSEATMGEECCNPLAAIVPCVRCGKKVHTCERAEPVNSDYRCPAHPDGVQLDDGQWACSQTCYDLICAYREGLGRAAEIASDSVPVWNIEGTALGQRFKEHLAKSEGKEPGQ